MIATADVERCLEFSRQAIQAPELLRGAAQSCLAEVGVLMHMSEKVGNV